MATYVFWYNETIAFKGYFEADNDEHAKQLLESFNKHEDMESQLPEFYSSMKFNDLEIDYDSLEGTN